MSFSLRQVRYFIAAAELGQISQAAVELNVSQSAVTAAIQQLEAILGGRLFDRVSQGVSLTPEGARFLQHGRNIMAAVNEAMRAPRMSNAATTGAVRIGITYTVAGYFLPQHHARFARSFPGLTIDLYEASRSTIEQALLDGALDIGVLLVSNLENREALASEILVRSRRRLWTATDHPLLKAEQVTLAEISSEPYVMLTVDEASQTAGRYWAKRACRPNVIFRTSSVEAVRSMVAAGMGVTILSDMTYRPWSLEGQRIETRIIADEVPSLDVGLAWKRDGALSSQAQTFRDFMLLAVQHGQNFSDLP
jgi:DNA-binding transcriptional LysR family regulator